MRDAWRQGLPKSCSRQGGKRRKPPVVEQRAQHQVTVAPTKFLTLSVVFQDSLRPCAWIFSFTCGGKPRCALPRALLFDLLLKAVCASPSPRKLAAAGTGVIFDEGRYAGAENRRRSASSGWSPAPSQAVLPRLGRTAVVPVNNPLLTACECVTTQARSYAFE